MKTGRTKPENHWRGVGAAIANRDGSLADLDRVITGKKLIDEWIVEGYAKTSKKRSRQAIKLALGDLATDERNAA